MTRLGLCMATLATFALLTGCCCGGGGGNWEEAFEAAMDEAMEEAAKEVADGEIGAEDEAEGGSGGAAKGPCAAYARCCSDYVAALGNLPGYPADAVDAAQQGCDAVQMLEGTPGGKEACKTSMDALIQGMDAMAAYPGWETPASCR